MEGFTSAVPSATLVGMSSSSSAPNLKEKSRRPLEMAQRPRRKPSREEALVREELRLRNAAMLLPRGVWVESPATSDGSLGGGRGGLNWN
jgi:hypothetical protein